MQLDYLKGNQRDQKELHWDLNKPQVGIELRVLELSEEHFSSTLNLQQDQAD